MSLTDLAKQEPFWPSGVRIVTTHISCALRLIQPVWALGQEGILKLAFASKHRDKFKLGEPRPLEKDTIFYSPIKPVEHFYLDPWHGHTMSSNTCELNELESAIQKYGLGLCFRTPEFPNRHYTKDMEGISRLGLLIWFWNGSVPKVKDFPFTIPYDDEGNKLDG